MRRTSRRLRSNSRSRESLRVAAVDAAKRVFVLAKKWERTGQYGGEMREARDAAKDAANAYFDDRNDPSGQAVGMATAVALLILYNNSKSALELLPTLRDKLSALDVDVAALEREAGLRKNSRRRTSRRLRPVRAQSAQR